MNDQPNPRVLIVEDDDFVRGQMKWALAAQYEVLLAEDRLSALDLFRKERPALVTLDLGLPPAANDVREGFLALSEMLEADPLVKVVVTTGQGERANALAAIGQGAYDFFCKPVDLEALRVVLGRALYVYQLECEHREVQNLDDFIAHATTGRWSPHMILEQFTKIETGRKSQVGEPFDAEDREKRLARPSQATSSLRSF